MTWLGRVLPLRESLFQTPFKIAAPSMVFGRDLLKNVRLLKDRLKCIEIVLFHTPSLHNLPTPEEIRELRHIGRQEDITFTVHLPASLEIACEDAATRQKSLNLALEILSATAAFDPQHYILHIPFSRPTLAPVPGNYFTAADQHLPWEAWTHRALASLEAIQREFRQPQKLLVENINYSPVYLETFWREGFCHLCLDLGHLMLGHEHVLDLLRQYLASTREIHLHGVKGDEEHLSLDTLPSHLVEAWMDCLSKADFEGIVNLEVFSASDLESSLDVVREVYCRNPKE